MVSFPSLSKPAGRRAFLRFTALVTALCLVRAVTPAHAGPLAEIEARRSTSNSKLDVDIEKTATLEDHERRAGGDLVVVPDRALRQAPQGAAGRAFR